MFRSNRARPVGREARRRGTAAAAALRGEVRARPFGWPLAAFFLALGLLLGALAGMLSRRRVLPPWEPPAVPAAPNQVIDLTATEARRADA